MKTQTIRRTALITGAGALALAAMAPAAASAQYRYTPSYGQAYDQQGQYYYDGCERSENNRAVVGGLLGAVAGAAIGNNTGSPRRNDENALIGGLLGAAVGAGVGKSTAACAPQQQRYDNRYSNTYSSGGYGYAPAQRYNSPQYSYGYAQPYGQGYGYNQGYAPDYGYGYGYGSGYDNRSSPQCTYVEDSVRMPDGRTQRRMVQACRDRNGRYQIVQ